MPERDDTSMTAALLRSPIHAAMMGHLRDVLREELAAAIGKAPEPWISAEQVAEHFGVEAGTVRSWTHEGRNPVDPAPHMVVGGRLRFRLSEIEAWHASRKGGAR